MSNKKSSISNTFHDKLVVEDFAGNTYVLYSVDICCGKALLINTYDNRLTIMAVTNLKCVSGETYDRLVSKTD
jgi:hypothetical protein